MPRDKSQTHARLLVSIREEFLNYGFEHASLKNIARNAGITPAGIYRHFSSKEAMFEEMVEPVTTALLELCDQLMQEAFTGFLNEDFLEYFPEFRVEKNKKIISFMYDHYDEFRMLLCFSKGTVYENYEEQLVEMEEHSVLRLFEFMDQRGIPHNPVTNGELRILSAALVKAGCEVIRYGYTRKEALKHMEFVAKLLYPGMKIVLGF